MCIFRSIASFLILIIASQNSYAANDFCSEYRLVDQGLHLKVNPRVPRFEQSLLWKVTHAKSPNRVSYIYGTIHSDNKKVMERSRKILPLLGDVDAYISEVSHNPGENLSKLLKSNKPVEELLGAEFTNLYNQTLAKMKLSNTKINQMKPWYNFSQLSRPKVSKFNLDKLFVDEALTVGMYTGGLQTTEQVIGSVERMGPKVELEVLKEVLCNFDLIQKQNKELTTFYANGELFEAYQAGHKYHTNDYIRYTQFMDAVVFHRNEVMIAKLTNQFLKKSVLVVFGFSHLIGEKGILNGLEKNGFELTPVRQSELELHINGLARDSQQKILEKYLPHFQKFINKKGVYNIPENSTEFPSMEFVSQSELQKIACDGTPCPILGLYDSENLNLTYSLIPSIKKDFYQRISVVFHEYVHYVQEKYGPYDDVKKQTDMDWSLREKEAHLLQLQFTQKMRTGGAY